MGNSGSGGSGSSAPPLLQIPQFQTASWAKLISATNDVFRARNGHASCVFNKKIWIVGGRSDAYQDYNLLQSYKQADVWSSLDGATWLRNRYLTGDFWAQNDDVIYFELATFVEPEFLISIAACF